MKTLHSPDSAEGAAAAPDPEIAKLQGQVKRLTEENATLSARVVELTSGAPKDRRQPHFSLLPKEKQDEKITVLAKDIVTVDGVRFGKDQQGQITLRQYHGLSRFFTRVAAMLLLLLSLSRSRAQVALTAGPPGSYGQIPVNMATNSLPQLTTNTSILSAPIALTRFDEFVFTWTGSCWGTGGATNWIFFYPEPDGTTNTLDTNSPVLSFKVTGGTATTNMLLSTNAVRALIGSCGYYMVGIGTAGTNASTNMTFKAWVKPIRSGQ